MQIQCCAFIAHCLSTLPKQYFNFIVKMDRRIVENSSKSTGIRRGKRRRPIKKCKVCGLFKEHQAFGLCRWVVCKYFKLYFIANAIEFISRSPDELKNWRQSAKNKETSANVFTVIRWKSIGQRGYAGKYVKNWTGKAKLLIAEVDFNINFVLIKNLLRQYII